MYNKNILNTIDSEEKAYILGYLSSFIYGNDIIDIYIKAHSYNISALIFIKSFINDSLWITDDYYNKKLVVLKINNETIYENVCKHLNMTGLNKLPVFPNLNENLIWFYIRGCFDSKGFLDNFIINKTPKCSITLKSKNIIDMIQFYSKIPSNISKIGKLWKLNYLNTNCLDFCGLLFNNTKKFNNLTTNRSKLDNWLTLSLELKLPYCYFYKDDENAIIPKKENLSDVGYDLTIIKKVKKISDFVYLFDTGIKIYIQHGYYAEIVPRSSIIKSGFMLANNIGIIDPSYTGNILVALVKLNKHVTEIILPFKCCQLIIRRQHHISVRKIDYNMETLRNDGGFGSTD